MSNDATLTAATVRSTPTGVQKSTVVAAALLTPLLASPPAAAHPHVWVNFETTVQYDRANVTGLSHKWSFDDMYTAMAIQGLDANSDGTYTREELAELAKVNIESMTEFGFFTVAKLGGQTLKFKVPTDAWLEHTNGVLSLHFTLPFEQPVMADAEGLTFAVYDESFFIAFDLVKDNPIKLAGAPEGCAANVSVPKEDLDQLQSLNDAFGGQLTAGDANQGMGMGYAQTVTLGCRKS